MRFASSRLARRARPPPSQDASSNTTDDCDHLKSCRSHSPLHAENINHKKSDVLNEHGGCVYMPIYVGTPRIHGTCSPQDSDRNRQNPLKIARAPRSDGQFILPDPIRPHTWHRRGDKGHQVCRAQLHYPLDKIPSLHQGSQHIACNLTSRCRSNAGSKPLASPGSHYSRKTFSPSHPLYTLAAFSVSSTVLTTSRKPNPRPSPMAIPQPPSAPFSYLARPIYSGSTLAH
jgi:hypothetical protein